MRILIQILIAIDQLFNALFGGWADETLSARAWRQQHKGGFWAVMRKVIDGIFFMQQDHCRKAFETEVRRGQSPPAIRPY